MEISKQQVLDAIYETIDEINSQFSLNIIKEGSTSIIANGGNLDSLGFVNFIASLEDKCQARFHLQLSLTEDAESGGVAHLSSIDELAAYIFRKCA